MKILNPIGSKERFLEMYQGVNKIQLNEVAINIMQSGTQLIEKAFEELKNKVANIKQTNTQTVGDENYLEIITNDNEGNQITFTFKVISNEADQDGVYNVSNAILIKFKLDSENFNVDWDENTKFIQEFNSNYGSEIINVVSDYANFETDSVGVDDEIYEEAINLIDKIPFKKGNETIQTHSAYADEKPTNPDLRVHSDELDSFVREMEDKIKNAEEDILDLPPDYSDVDAPTADDGSKGIDPYDQAIADAEAGKGDWEIGGKKLEKPKKAPPYMDDTGDKKRAVPSWAEDFMENKEVGDVNTDDLVNRNYNKLLSPEMKEFFIRKAREVLEQELGIKKEQIPRDEYSLMVKNKAIDLYKLGSSGMNEDTEKDNYPDQIGKKFKPKNQFPKKKKRPQSVVKLSEDDYEDVGDAPRDNIGVEFEDNLDGGLADNKEPKDFDPKQLAMGLEVEMEHTDDPKIALEIAMDHLMEIPDYYTHLDKMEDEAGVEEPKQDSEEIETDELLGYKPFNVNDYTNEDMEEYTGDIGDRYQDADDNQYTVRGKDNDSVRIQGQEGEREVDTSDLQLLKKISEEKENKKEIITEEQIKTARLVLKDRDFSNAMTKKEAVQLLIRHNIR